MKASLLTGIPFLFVSLILGMQWAIVALDVWSFFDMKIIGSFFLLAVYGSVLFLKRSGKLTGNDFAWANVFAFFLLSSIFSSEANCPDSIFGYKGLVINERLRVLI